VADGQEFREEKNSLGDGRNISPQKEEAKVDINPNLLHF